MSRPPSPPGHPLIGHTLQYLRSPTDFHSDHIRAFGDVVKVNLVGRSFHYVTHPDDINRILVDDANSFRKASVVRKTLGSFGGEGLFFTEGDQWRRQRTLSQPAFYRERVEEYATFTVDSTRDIIQSWDNGERICVDATSQELTLDVLAQTLFGVTLDDDPRTGQMIRNMTHAINDRLDATSPGTFLPNWVPTLRDRRFGQAMATFESKVADLVADRRLDPDPPADLLTLLVRAHDDGELSARELSDQLVTFLFAGHETTSLALTYTCYLLAANADIQAQVQTEVDSVLNDDPTIEDYAQLEYTTAVIEESLRLFPPVYMVLREPSRDVRLRGYTLSAGQTMILPQTVVHRDPRWWDDPEMFRPERWLEHQEPHSHEYAFFPFGGGPRHCIGMRFARLELKAALATLCRNVTFTDPPDDLPLSFAVTLQPGADVELTVHTR